MKLSDRIDRFAYNNPVSYAVLVVLGTLIVCVASFWLFVILGVIIRKQ